MNLTPSTIMGLAMDGAIVEDRAPGFGTNNDALWAAQAYLTPLTVCLYVIPMECFLLMVKTENKSHHIYC
ncbi:hypothetical protein NXY15_01175 [Bacteroides thetaiotaomicron]|nr:hypothetical protein NXY15_01175 [Bacteroides thetaiotaomicron]